MNAGIKALFDKYFAGKHSRKEEASIFRAMGSGNFDDELKESIADADWNSEEFSDPSADQLNRLDRIFEQIEGEIGVEDRPEKLRWLSHSVRRFAAVLAGLLILTAVAYYGFYRENLRTITAAYGEIKEVKLSDGSVVTLNANSSLKFFSSWEASANREVWLDGEAYFSVSHRENGQKFIVHSNELAIEVIGTEFNVNNRRGTNRVVLRSGKIKITPGTVSDKSVLMKPGDLLELTQKDSLTIQTVNPGRFSAWKDGRLVFESTPLSEIARMIEDNYGFEVLIEDKNIAALTYTADIPSDKLDVLLETLSESFGVEIQREESKIVFK